ncbi:MULTISPECIES: alpha/beta hydrolase family protein [Bacteroides]|jgi:predicted esterase|uniref:alpha/beta hydrolase family protein n=1 Tax=Bacteroides TaxID=816 RepID=UPI000E764404|nr:MULTISPECIES: alpha/beta hydrolase [Bacteroides]RJV67928.1 alpha/beta hydrolase [Bacteroides sp. AF04-22]DAS10679.1 MAG TPA: dipeptidyl aminopeptidase/acylaminoacyl-peptidase [Caudoviricetes sp.]
MGKRFIFILMACSLLSIATVVHAQYIDKQTYTFAIKKADTLKLDKYVMIDQIQGTQSKPVILFAFGGGFKGGRRDNPDYISYFHFLARAGYVVVSTDYRTQLKDIDKSEYSDLQGFSSALQQAITCAVEDFGDATNYIIEHSVEWQINPAQIIACGSSAGAITALQAEYEICNQTAFADRLPANFNYAGVISFSGAICANGIPKWIMSPCPLMLFHGDADSTVPFTKAVVEEEMGLWGSNFICMQLKEKETAYYFYIAEGIGHSLSYSPMKDNRHDILSFLNRLVLGKEKRCITTVEKNPEISRYKSDFTIEDYIRENMR